MNQKRNVPVPGEFYRHFKNRMYQIVALASHSETGEAMVVYQALYGEYKVWVRPLSMFMEEVDKEKYPDVKQVYRFEKVCPGGAGMQEKNREEMSGEALEESGWSNAPDTEQAEAAEPEMNPHLLAFFDAMDIKNYDKMLECLSKMGRNATEKEIGDLCLVLDVQIPLDYEDALSQIAFLKRHILTLKKFDGERLR